MIQTAMRITVKTLAIYCGIAKQINLRHLFNKMKPVFRLNLISDDLYALTPTSMEIMREWSKINKTPFRVVNSAYDLNQAFELLIIKSDDLDYLIEAGALNKCQIKIESDEGKLSLSDALQIDKLIIKALAKKESIL